MIGSGVSYLVIFVVLRREGAEEEAKESGGR
jgi:hypothetical protein